MWEQLIKFIKKNDIQEAEKIINLLDGEELDKKNSKGETALHLAAKNCQPQLVKMLLEKMSLEAINSYSDYGYGVLHYAFLRNKIGFFERGENLNLSIREMLEIHNHILLDEQTHWQEQSEIIIMLIEKMTPEDFFRTDKHGETIFHLIAKSCSQKIVNDVIKKINDPTIFNVLTPDNKTLLHLVTEAGINSKAMFFLKNMDGQAINVITKDGYTALLYAAKYCDEEVAIAILEKMNDQSINAITKKGVTALHIACAKGLKNLVIILLDKLNDQTISAITTKGKSIFNFALTQKRNEEENNKKKYEIVNILIKKLKPESVNIILKKSEKILDLAMNFSNKLAKMVIDQMSPEDLAAIDKDDNNYTILHKATMSGDIEIVEILLKKMTQDSIDATSESGATSLHLLCGAASFLIEHNYASKEIINNIAIMLIEKMSNKALNFCALGRTTALYFAYVSNLYEIAELLIEKMSPEAISISDKHIKSWLLYYATKAGLPNHVYSLVMKMTPQSLFKQNLVELNKVISKHIKDENTKDLLLNNITGAKLACNIYFSKELTEGINQVINFNDHLSDICQNILKIKLINYGLYKYQNIAEYKQFIKSTYNQDSSALLINKITNDEGTGLLDILEEQIMVIESSLMCQKEEIYPMPYKLFEKYQNNNNSEELMIRTIKFYESHPQYKITGNYLREKLEQDIEGVKQILSFSETLIKSLEDLKHLMSTDRGIINMENMKLDEESLNLSLSEESNDKDSSSGEEELTLDNSSNLSDTDVGLSGEINN